MLQLDHISKSFGSLRALSDVSFRIPKGKITILAGADGAGKSTLFKILIGLVKKESGSILLEGSDIGDNPKKIAAVAGYMPERFSLYPDLSIEENMNFFADINQVPYRRREELKLRLLQTTGLLPFRKRKAGALSGGMKQKLALSTILLSAPQLIILDEPTTGVDPLSRIEFFSIIRDLKEEGKTIIISTPYLDEAEHGDFIVFLKEGRIIKQDWISHLKEHFPARLYKIIPDGNIFEILDSLKQNKNLRDNVYVRGNTIKYLQTGAEDHLHLIPHTRADIEEPKLEDIYIFYEKTAASAGLATG